VVLYPAHSLDARLAEIAKSCGVDISMVSRLN
jgi:hypothetical protein